MFEFDKFTARYCFYDTYCDVLNPPSNANVNSEIIRLTYYENAEGSASGYDVSQYACFLGGR